MTTPAAGSNPQGNPAPDETNVSGTPETNPTAPSEPLFTANSQEELNAKFGSTRHEGRMSIVKDLGFEKIEDLKSAVTNYSQHVESQKTEMQKAEDAKKAAETNAQTYQGELRQMRLEREAEKQAVALGANPERVDALMKLRTPGAGEVDDQGNIAGDVLKASMEQALAAYPEFKKAPAKIGGGSNPASGASETTLDTQISEAQKKGDFSAVIALQMQKLTTPS